MAKGGVAQFLLGVTPSPAFAVPRTAVTGVLMARDDLELT
jgi:hypothetical protein